jgi:hypothetical protein
VSFININLTLGETMKQINKTIVASIAAIVLSSNAFANNIIIDKALVEAEMAANLNTMTAEITLPRITETAKMQIDNIIMIATSKAKSGKTVSTPAVEATAE